jgi:hypothetical protein
MTLNKKLLASALVAGLAMSANANAAIVLGVDDPLVFASELDDGTTLATTADDIDLTIGYNFSNGEVRYGRFECSSNMTLDNVTLNETGGNVALGAINGEGTSSLFFSMTGNGMVSDADTISVVADNTLEDGGSVSCSFSIYDQPSQAQSGGSTGRIYTTGSETVITRASGFVFAMDPNGTSSATADVEDPNGAYFGFTGADAPNAYFGNLQFEAAADVLKADGTQIALSDMFTTDTFVTVDGDFSTAGDVWWENYADAFDDESATFGFGGGVVDTTADLWFEPTTTDAIQESEYTATLHVDAQAGYDVSDVGPIHVGSIVRNGTQLQAPLAQVPGAGWLSRMVLTNTGSVDRPYEISVMGETGNTIGTDNTTGTVPANGTVVVDLTQVMTSFTAGQQRRGTLNVTVAAPNNQIQGLYQIVNANTGSISNHVMVRPGTN